MKRGHIRKLTLRLYERIGQGPILWKTLYFLSPVCTTWYGRRGHCWWWWPPRWWREARPSVPGTLSMYCTDKYTLQLNAHTTTYSIHHRLNYTRQRTIHTTASSTYNSVQHTRLPLILIRSIKQWHTRAKLGSLEPKGQRWKNVRACEQCWC